MSRPLSFEQVRALRLRAQRLAGRPCASASEAVASVIGVQAQAIQPAQLAVRARSTGLAAEDVTRACHADRSLVRTWSMRGTLHLVAAADVRWLLRLLGPRQAARDRRRRQRLGLDDRLLARSLEAIPQIMAGRGPLAREELVRLLARQGVVVDLAAQASAHLVLYAALQGVICVGPETRRNRATYVLLDEWLPAAPAMEPEPALAELARRYLAGYGPATPAGGTGRRSRGGDLAPGAEGWSGGDPGRAVRPARPGPGSRAGGGVRRPRSLPRRTGPAGDRRLTHPGVARAGTEPASPAPSTFTSSTVSGKAGGRLLTIR